MASEPTLRVQFLGPVRAWRGEQELGLGSPQQQAMLVLLLASRGNHVSVSAAIDALWGERPPRTAADLVRTHVSRLRSCLRGNTGARAGWAIQAVSRGYVFTLDSPAIDACAFESLVQEGNQANRGGEAARAARLLGDALALWHGTPLAGVPGPYAAGQRVRLEELRVTATEERIAAELESGHYLNAVPDLQVQLGADPLRERVAELLMLALYRSGRRAEALSVFAATRRRLREDLGIEPGLPLQAMQRQILRADSELLCGTA